MNFFYTSDFEDSIKELISKKKLGYFSCNEDIKCVFNEMNFNEIWNFRDNILDFHPYRLIKTRIPNSGQNLSKRDGFRLLFIANKEKESITFLYVFPKKGRYAKINVTEKEIEKLIQNYSSEIKNNTLKVFEF